MGFIRRRDELSSSQEFVDRFSIKTPSLRHKVEYLSGGNQQKVLLARWLMKKLQVIILDEPTRGIDVGAKAEIHEFMDRLVAEGAAVLMVSSDLPEIMGMSDRIYVMHEGRIAGEFAQEQAKAESVVACAMGRPFEEVENAVVK